MCKSDLSHILETYHGYRGVEPLVGEVKALLLMLSESGNVNDFVGHVFQVFEKLLHDTSFSKDEFTTGAEFFS